ncbi:MAG: hypothetical protein CVT64_01915 [Actinobacteria bacterium HGW-Actinobacteria-4]|nr:MAG: hypothetical protein CVT64_01915 [Actinobacteria bacterium HGW-Actinobacteria-4]
MFGRSRRTSHDSIDVDKYRAQAQEAAEAAVEAAQHAAVAAKKAARRAQEWAGPQYESAKEWAAPRAEKAYHAGARKAKPYVERAGGKAEHWADVVHGAIVGSAIPAVLHAVDNAAREEDDERGINWGAIVIPMVIAAAAGAALVAWARRDPGRDSWAGEDEEWEFSSDGDFKDQLRHNINKAADTATAATKKAVAAATAAAGAAGEAVAERAGPVAERAKSEAHKLADRAAPVAERAKSEAHKLADLAAPAAERAKAEAARVVSNLEAARSRAAAEVAHTIDDAEDVWEDEPAASDDAPSPAEVKKATTQAKAKAAPKKSTGGTAKK